MATKAHGESDRTAAAPVATPHPSTPAESIAVGGDASPRTPGNDGSPPKTDDTARVLGVIILAVFFVLVIVLFTKLGLSETAWARATYLYAGVEAIAFSAAGYFFGKEVHRERADTAEQQAEDAKNESREARIKEAAAAREATVVKANAAALKQLIDARIAKLRVTSRGDQPAGQPGQPDLMIGVDSDLPPRPRPGGSDVRDWEEIRAFADKLFPGA